MVDGIEIEFDGFFFFLRVGLVDVSLGLDHLENEVFFASKTKQ
jgi:hypothetical protein